MAGSISGLHPGPSLDVKEDLRLSWEEPRGGRGRGRERRGRAFAAAFPCLARSPRWTQAAGRASPLGLSLSAVSLGVLLLLPSRLSWAWQPLLAPALGGPLAMGQESPL